MSGPFDPDQPEDLTGPEESVDAGEAMAGFRRKARGVSARFTAAQAEILRNLVAQVAELLGHDPAEGGPHPGAGPAPGGREAGGPSPVGQAGDDEMPGIDDLAAILGSGGPTDPPDDPVLARLLPDAYQNDPEAAGEFRHFTEQGLRAGKVAAAQTVLDTLPSAGGRVRLSDGDAQAWLRALNDVRLALGVRLGITDDYQAELGGVSRDDPRAAHIYVYDWLTFLQETLVRALW